MAGIALLYRQALAYAHSLRQPGQAIIALGHCHMVGGEISQDSERRIVIGGTEALSANIFDASVAYAALGHLHLAQLVGKQTHLRYCGSPLPLSFAEVTYQHQVLRVDLAGESTSEITPLLIITKLEQYDVAGATAIAVVMLVVSFALLLTINALQTWARRRQGGV